MSFQKGIKYLSPTSLKTFKSCPFKYDLRYNKKHPVSDITPPYVFDIGNCVHKLGETFHISEKNETSMERDLKVKRWMNNFKLDGMYTNTITEQYDNLKEFLIPYLENSSITRISREGKIGAKIFEKLYINGKADILFFYGNGDLLIIDYKSSKEREDHSIQLGIYAYGGHMENKIEVNQITCGIFYTRYNDFVSEKYDKEKIKKIMKNILEINAEIKNTKEFKKNVNQYCGYCEFRSHCQPENYKH